MGLVIRIVVGGLLAAALWLAIAPFSVSPDEPGCRSAALVFGDNDGSTTDPDGFTARQLRGHACIHVARVRMGQATTAVLLALAIGGGAWAIDALRTPGGPEEASERLRRVLDRGRGGPG